MSSNRTSSSSSRPRRLTPEERELQILLAEGTYHLPTSQNWRQDLRQYFANNHPLFSPCFQNRLHPISKGMRAVGIVGSIMFGLILTNIAYLGFIEDSPAQDAAVFEISAGGFAVYNGTSFVYLDEDSTISKYTSIEVSKGMVILWSVGAAAHSLFDSFLWYATSCMCLGGDPIMIDNDEDEDDKDYGKGCKGFMMRHRKRWNLLVLFAVLLVSAVATLAVVIRATVEGSGQDVDETLQQLKTAGFDANQLNDKDNYEFLLSFAVELGLAWFVWFPFLETIFFSGILSCGGRLPFFGGRPGKIRSMEAQKAEEMSDRMQKKGSSSTKQRKSSTNNGAFVTSDGVVSSLNAAEEGRSSRKQPKKSLTSTSKKSTSKKSSTR